MPSTDLNTLAASLSNEDYCYLTTKGRVSGNPHKIEIWFGIHASNLYLLSGGGLDSDWVKNLLREPKVDVRIDKFNFSGKAMLVNNPEEDKLARELLAAKYYRWKKGKPLNDWARTATPVVVKLSVK